MIAVDADLLVYAHRDGLSQHAAAKACLNRLWNGDQPWLIPWPCIHEFYSVVTNPKLFKPPTSVQNAIEQIDVWLDSSSLALGCEAVDHWPILRDLLTGGDIVGSMVHDAKIAAICLRAGVNILYTADRDFSRFPDLRCENPLIA